MRLVLVGAGHAHLHLVRHAPRLREAGVDVTLVAPPTFHYSGVATAVAVGALPASAGTVDVAALAADRGVAHVPVRAVGLDHDRRRVRAADGREVPHDVVSLNVGSVPATNGIDVADEVLRVKPLAHLRSLAGRLDALPPSPRVVVVGAGATGLEIAGHVSHRLAGDGEVVVVDRAWVPAGFLRPAPRHAALRVLVGRGVTFRVGARVTTVEPDGVGLAGAPRLAADLVVLATGLVANPVVEDLGLGDHRGVPVRATLQHVDHDDVLAAGDCAHFTPAPLPRLGVHGVRQGPVLLAGLVARVTGRPLPTYTPPRHALQVVDLGGGRGLAVRGRWWSEGPGPLRLKRVIDRRWVRQHGRAGTHVSVLGGIRGPAGPVLLHEHRNGDHVGEACSVWTRGGGPTDRTP